MIPTWVDIGRKLLGEAELPGDRDNPKILELYAAAGHPEVKHDELAWCAAFVGACLARAGIKPSGSLGARSYERWGRELSEPCFGCVGVMKRPGASWTGHTGFVVGTTADLVIMLNGNVRNRVEITAVARTKFTAFRWPLEMSVPSNLPQLASSLAGAAKALA